MLVRFTVLALLLAASECSFARNPLALVVAYQEFANEHHVEQLLDMYAKDARLDFGPMGVIEGKDRIGAIHDYDRAINTELLLENCRLEEHRVICQTTERNDWLQTAGIERIVYSESVFTFDEAGRIESISATLSPESSDSLGSALASFDAWARANKPEDYALLFREDMSFNYSYESGRQVLSLLREWRAVSAVAKAPLD